MPGLISRAARIGGLYRETMETTGLFHMHSIEEDVGGGRRGRRTSRMPVS